ncbi:TonB-dependent receptor plug domain-containing protein, partial [Bacteroides finegoldii]
MLGLCPVSKAWADADLSDKQVVMQTQKKVKGQVIDATGEPLIGVNISVIGGTEGTITDIDGNYTVSVPTGAKLKFSYIGYKDQLVEVGTQTIVNVKMQEDSEVLDEVVVVGYGSQKKETLTGAVTVVSDKMLENKGAMSSPVQALQGQVPGVIITRSSGAPGDESWGMKLRGAVSANSTDPLIIIDGVEYESVNELRLLNSADIESINFLKDASAAIYGSK